jgi:hypothetical protein
MNRVTSTKAILVNLIELVQRMCLAGVCMCATAHAADEVPSFKSGEYQVTTSFGDSQTMSEKVCLTDYADWFATLKDKVAERGCELRAEGQSGAVYRYAMACSNGASGKMAVTKVDESHFESVTEITIPIGGFEQTISTRDSATRLGDCPPE